MELSNVYSIARLPTGVRFEPYRKKAPTYAIRIEGKFVVQTSDGLVQCDDGWLALDSRGYPYPIDADEFARSFEEIPPGTGKEARTFMCSFCHQMGHQSTIKPHLCTGCFLHGVD